MINFYKNDIPSDVNFGNFVAIDTEAMGLNIFNDRLCLVQLSSGDGNAHLIQIEKGDSKRSTNLKNLLTDHSVKKLFHFARFDLALLNYTFGIHIRNIYCTKIASKIARTYTERHGLKELCKELLSVDLSKHEQSSYWGNDNLTKEQLKYAANDVLYLHQLMSALDNMLANEGRKEIAEKCFAFLEETVVQLDISNRNIDFIFSH